MTARHSAALGVLSAGVLCTAGVGAAAPSFTLIDESVSVSVRTEMGVLQQKVVVDHFSAVFAEITAENPDGMFQKAIVTDLGPYRTTTSLDQMFEFDENSISGFASFAVETNNLDQQVDSGYDIHQDLGIVFSLSEATTIGYTTFIENNGLLINPEIRLMDSLGNIVLSGDGSGEIDLDAGDYTLVAMLSGRDKFNIETSQSASFGYSFVMLPSPGTIGLVGMAGLVLIGRRRR